VITPLQTSSALGNKNSDSSTRPDESKGKGKNMHTQRIFGLLGIRELAEARGFLFRQMVDVVFGIGRLAVSYLGGLGVFIDDTDAVPAVYA